MRRLPVSAHTYHVLANVGAASTTKARLDAALVLNVTVQVVLVHVSPVAAGSRTRVDTFVIVFWIGKPRGRLECVGFVRSVASSLARFRGRGALLYF